MSEALMVIDVDAIDQLSQDLASAAADLEESDTSCGRCADAVGYPELSQTVTNSSTKWEVHRKKAVDVVKGLSEASAALAEGWRDFDQQGADALNGVGSDHQTAPRPGTSVPSAF